MLKKLEEITKNKNMVEIDMTVNKKGLGYAFWQKAGVKKTDYVHMCKKVN
ncbi:MAG: hypothetical protein ABH828_00925 [archaeon]